MSGRAESYTVLHLELDGALIDRDEAFPDVHFELHPVGTSLPPDQQQRELVIIVGEGGRHQTTRLDGDATRELRRWLSDALETLP